MITKDTFNEKTVANILGLAGFKVIRTYTLKNKYWPDLPEYHMYAYWYLVRTEFGLIEIGPRKRVMSINWEDTSTKLPNLTSDNVTKTDYLVHADSIPKTIEYLTSLNTRLKW